MDNYQKIRFEHNRIEYVFKWAKKKKVIEQIPIESANRISKYFQVISQRNIPHDLFNNPRILRCSSFRIKNLQRGAQNEIKISLIEQNKIKPFTISTAAQSPELTHICSLIEITNGIFEDYENQGFLDYKPSHDDILTQIILTHNFALSTEVPVWTRRKSSLEKFIISKNCEPSFNCQFPHSITGHIDLLMWDPNENCLIVADYKPEGYFLRSLPQVAIYGLILRNNLQLKRVLCVSFNKDEGWLYDPQILISDIDEAISLHGNPPLKWRKIIKGFTLNKEKGDNKTITR
ncbi:MAG: hypothetical protein ACTSRK_04020 [Promethearchaeota archaeon]